MQALRAQALLIALLLSACTGGQTTTRDGGGDAGSTDLGEVDLGAADAGVVDTGSDSGVDAGSLDASDDAGPTDATQTDATQTDATQTDATQADASADAGVDAGTPSGVLLVIGGGATSIFTAESAGGVGWQTSTLLDSTDVAPALALTSPTSAIAVIRSTASSGALRYSTWAPSTFTPFVGIASGVTTRAPPSLTLSGAGADLVFHGDNFRHYFARWSTFSWSPTAEPIAFQASPSFGPTPPSNGVIGSDHVAVYAGSDGDLYDQARVAGVWQAAHAHNLGGGGPTLTPSLIPLSGSDDAMIVFVRASDGRIRFTTRNAGGWSAASDVDANALSNNPVALSPLANGGALLAYRGQNAGLYFSRYTAGSGWTAPAPIAVANPTTSTTPSLASGVGGADAELVFVSASGGSAQHARWFAGSWTPAVTVGGSGLLGVALASSP